MCWYYIYDNLVYVGCCATNSGNSSIKIFTLDGNFITSLREFVIKHRILLIVNPFSLLIEKADNELGLFLCDPWANIVFCSTDNQCYSLLVHNQPSDIKSDRFVLFILLTQSYSPILMVDKFDICTSLSIIYPGLGYVIRSRIRTSYVIYPNSIKFIAIHPIREEIYISKCEDGLLQVYNWEGNLIESVFSEYLYGTSNLSQHGLATDVHGFVYVLVDSRIVRVDMKRDRFEASM